MTRNRILFVEDNRLCSLVNCAVVREGGFDVVEAYCAAEAFEAIDRHDPLAALVTDINLGDGADGFEVARHARLAYPDLPVIYISAASAARFPLEGVGGSELIDKPFHPQQIVEALDRLTHLEALLPNQAKAASSIDIAAEVIAPLLILIAGPIASVH